MNKKGQNLPITSLDVLELIKIGIIIFVGIIIFKALFSAM